MEWSKVEYALEALRINDQKIVQVSERIACIPEEVFVQWFPSSYGIQVIHESWGLRLISSPALPRECNNCWSIISQMNLWKCWFRAIGLKFPHSHSQRLLSETIHHTATPLPFLPNPIETHPMIDSLTSIFASDDNLAVLDHSIRAENDAIHGQEYCEIRIGMMPSSGSFPPPEFGPFPPLEPIKNIDFNAGIEKLFSQLNVLKAKEIMGLYHLLLMKDREIRNSIPYSIIQRYYPLRRRSSASKKKYLEILKNNPFQISEKGTSFCIVTNAPFRSYEQYASDAFISELSYFLKDKKDWFKSFQNLKYELSILQKSSKPDGDNLPFDSIFYQLKINSMIPLTNAVTIQYSPEMEHSVCIMLSPV